MTYSLLPAVLLTTLGLFAADLHDKTLEALLKVPQFAFGGVGFSGLTSEGEKDYNEILTRPSAETDFQKVFQLGNAQAKCYALVALHKLNHDRFMQFALPLRKSNEQVSTMTGCLVHRRALAAVISDIETSVYWPKK